MSGPWFYPASWYYSVLDQSPGTQVWQATSGSFVALANADYVAFQAATNPFTGQLNQAVVVDTAADMYLAIVGYNIQNTIAAQFNAGGSSNPTMTADVQLTNPVPSLMLITSSSAGHSLIFPQSNLFGSIAPGQQILIANATANSVTVKNFGGTTIGTVPVTGASPSFLLVVQPFQSPSFGALTNQVGSMISKQL